MNREIRCHENMTQTYTSRRLVLFLVQQKYMLAIMIRWCVGLSMKFFFFVCYFDTISTVIWSEHADLVILRHGDLEMTRQCFSATAQTSSPVLARRRGEGGRREGSYHCGQKNFSR